MQWTCFIEKESAHLFGAVYMGMIHYVALAYPTVPDHQQQQDYKSFVEPTESPPVSEMSRSYGRPCEKRVAVPLSKGKYPFFDWTVDLHNRVNADCDRPMIRKSLGPSTNTGTDVGASVYAVHVRHHRRYPMLRTVLDVLCCTRNARMRRDMGIVSAFIMDGVSTKLAEWGLICAR
jgi:hypothetical protein